jgi:hypothetical protein
MKKIITNNNAWGLSLKKQLRSYLDLKFDHDQINQDSKCHKQKKSELYSQDTFILQNRRQQSYETLQSIEFDSKIKVLE